MSHILFSRVMEAKLKSLKVVDLKAVLSHANISVTSKTTKADLISKILAAPSAIEAYNALHPSQPVPASHNDDLLAPPEDLDWTSVEAPLAKVEQAAQAAPKPSQEYGTAAPSSGSSATTEPLIEEPPSTEDPEIERRKKRAERFGIPLVEPKAQKKAAVKPTEDTDKLKVRAERFESKGNGKSESGRQSPGSKRKRGGASVATPAAEIDPEEAERRRKRAERFGLKV
ncbi:hypothetical protein D9757_004306 [Collybiopsis confluens]|uniref:THO1-MOS11 C-terminal domain-containing protein n=1 Tax=Collybiopsis confluens TaxID=2823264 RepID=A0A8H5MD07_9AGAR|nr:hypothetical protein D9757_004306 [Collybiopsis confluens]